MRKSFFISLCLLLALSCTRNTPQEGPGRLHLSLDPIYDVDLVTKSTIEDFGITAPADSFKITIYNTSKVTVWEGYFKQWSDTLGIAGGSYFVSASYGDESYQKAYLADVVPVEIKAWDIVSVTLKPSLKNAILRVNCSDYVQAYYTDRSFTVSSVCIDSLAVQEGKHYFLEPAKTTLKCDFVTQGGLEKEFSFDLGSFKEDTFYDLTVESSNIGGSSFQISFNDTVYTVEIEEELNNR